MKAEHVQLFDKLKNLTVQLRDAEKAGQEQKVAKLKNEIKLLQRGVDALTKARPSFIAKDGKWECMEKGCSASFPKQSSLVSHYKKEHRSEKLDLERDFEKIRANEVTTVCYIHRELGDKGVADLVAALESNTSVTTLKLYGNKITDKGAIPLAALITKHQGLQFVAVRWNWIGDPGAEALSRAMKVNFKLHVDCGKNKKMTDKGYSMIQAAQSYASKMREEKKVEVTAEYEVKKAKVQSLVAMAQSEMEQKNYEEAEKLYQKAMELCDEPNIAIGKALREARKAQREEKNADHLEDLLTRDRAHTQNLRRASTFAQSAAQYKPVVVPEPATKDDAGPEPATKDAGPVLRGKYPLGAKEFNESLAVWSGAQATAAETYWQEVRVVDQNNKPDTTFAFDIQHEQGHSEGLLTELIEASPSSSACTAILVEFASLGKERPEWAKKLAELNVILMGGIERLETYKLHNNDEDLATLLQTHLLAQVTKFIEQSIEEDLVAEDAQVKENSDRCTSQAEEATERRSNKKIAQALVVETDLQQKSYPELMTVLQHKVKLLGKAQQSPLQTEIEETLKASSATLNGMNEFHSKRKVAWNKDVSNLTANHEEKTTDLQERTQVFEKKKSEFEAFLEADQEQRQTTDEKLQALLLEERERQAEYNRQVQSYVHLERVQGHEEELRKEMNIAVEARLALLGKTTELDTKSEELLASVSKTLDAGLDNLQVRFAERMEDLRVLRGSVQNQHLDVYEKFYELGMVQMYRLFKQLARVKEQVVNAEDDLEFAAEQGQEEQVERTEKLLEVLGTEEASVVGKLDTQEAILAAEEPTVAKVLEETGRESCVAKVQKLLDDMDAEYMAKRRGRNKKQSDWRSDWRTARGVAQEKAEAAKVEGDEGEDVGAD